MRKVFIVVAVAGAIAVAHGCTGDLEVGPWLGEGGTGERGPGANATVGVGGMGGMGGVGGSPVEDCTDPEYAEKLTQEVKDALYPAQLCDPSIDQIKCDLFVPGMCCDEVVDPGKDMKNMPNVDHYLEVLQKWKDAGCQCPDDPPVCPPHEDYGTCDPEGFSSEKEGICKKI